jgi:dnaJ-class molecular chaperone with C-terminal Zn finger domain
MLELKRIKKALQTLGFEGVVTVEQTKLKQAYKRRSKEVHPDVEGGSHEEFKALQEAYELLLEHGLGQTVDLVTREVLVTQGSDLLRYHLAEREYKCRL